MLPDFNRLKVFYYIYSLNSVVGAAGALHLSQPAVSQHLRKLESEIKMHLFTRLHKGMAPTAAGDRLFEIVKPFVSQLEEGITHIRRPMDRPSGPLRIGTPVEFGKQYLPRLCHLFRKMHPEVTFTLKLGESLPILNLVKDGRLDFALVDFFLVEEQVLASSGLYSVEPVFEEELVLACSKAYYDLEVKGDCSFENLVGKEFICDEHDEMVLFHWFRHHFNRTDRNLNVVMTVDNHQAVVTGLKLGMGLGVTASHFIWEDLIQGAIIPVKTLKKNMINKISMIQLQDKIPTLTEKTFYRYFQEEMTHLKELAI